jgi:hypothetical protein
MAKKKVSLKEGEFSYKGKVYKSIMHAVDIPGLGVRTALEISVDEEAQEYLVKNGCVGSVIVEVVANDDEEQDPPPPAIPPAPPVVPLADPASPEANATQTGSEE